jgi:hypothetical protein
MCLQKVKSRKKYVFVGVLKLKDDRSRIQNRIHWSEARIRRSGFVPKCHGSTTVLPIMKLSNRNHPNPVDDSEREKE